MSESDYIGRLGAGIHRYHVTIGLTLFLGSVYALQMLAATRFPPEGSVPGAGVLPPAVAILLAPWLHSDITHLLSNGVLLGLTAALVEREVGHRRLLGFILFSGYPSTMITAHTVYGGVYPYGISGAVWGVLVFTGGMAILDSSALSLDDRLLVIVLLATAAGMILFPLLSLLYSVDVLPDPEGVAVSAHVFGAACGVTWFCIELRRGVLQPR